MTATPEQMTAITDGSKFTLINAAAGSGKTFVLAERIAEWIKQGNEPSKMLAITFTRKAARELAARVIEKAGDRGEHVMVKTFHAFCVEIIRRYGYLCGYHKFSIYDEYDAAYIMEREVRRHCHKTPDKQAPRVAVELLECRANRITPKKADYQRAIGAYETALKQARALDFEGLESLALTLLDKYEQAREWLNQFTRVLIDEVQDTSKAQWKLISHFTKSPDFKNLTVVGDDRQSIYGWRGAYIDGIIGFADIYGATELPLTINFRSYAEIVDCAERLIKHNRGQLDKRVVSHRGDGGEIDYRNYATEGDEIYDVITQIVKQVAEGVDVNKIAILTRTRRDLWKYVEALEAAQAPVVPLVKHKFLEARDVRVCIALMRLAANGYDDESYEMVLFNHPPFGTPERNRMRGLLMMTAASASQSLLDHETTTTNYFPEIRDLVDRFRGRAFTAGVLHVFKESKIGMHYLWESEHPHAALRLFLEWADKPARRGMSLSEFLEELALFTATDEDDEREGVRVATVHAAKGLEWKTVFIPNFRARNYPNAMAMRDGQVDEERRLVYVAMTRARDALYVSWHYDSGRPGGKGYEASQFATQAGLPEACMASEKTLFDIVKHEAVEPPLEAK